MDKLLPEVRTEIESLHEFFVAWFTGAVENTDEVFARGFVERFDPDFLLIPPAGKQFKLEQLADSIRTAHGSNPEFGISIHHVALRHREGPLVLATYEEWQRNARASTPADNGRVATALFRVTDERLRWLHVHETWLPAEVMAAGPGR